MYEDDDIHRAIEPIITYYRNLDLKNRIKFVQRVQYFASNFEFAGTDGFEITNEAKYLLCCPLAQITFGLEEFL
jgi:Mlc titration factor MtfA (ptsG expression regulator)